MKMNKGEACIAGTKLLDKMKSDQWKLEIWENCGWHFKVSLAGLLYIHKSGKSYMAYLSRDGGGGSETFWNIDISFEDPNMVAQAQLEEAEKFIDECQEVVNILKEKI